jgi:hypothetical protein
MICSRYFSEIPSPAASVETDSGPLSQAAARSARTLMP